MKGLTMSRLDVLETETTLLEQSKITKSFTEPSDLHRVHEKTETIHEEEIDLQEWLEIFAEDQVKMEGCR